MFRRPGIASRWLIISATQGWMIFTLQYAALSKVASAAGGMMILPWLFLGQGLSAILFGALARRGDLSSLKKQWLLLSLLSASLCFYEHNSLNAVPSLALTAALFLAGQILISFLRTTSQLVFAARLSLLQSPETTTLLAMSEEFGFLLGAVALLAEHFLHQSFGPIAWTLPIVGGFVLMMHSKTNQRPQKLIHAHEEPSKSHTSFLPALLLSFGVIAALKWILAYGFVQGLRELSRTQIPLDSLFSSLAFLQSTLTLSALFWMLRTKKTITWFKGFQIILGHFAIVLVASATSSFLSVEAFAITLCLGEVTRKILEHGLYSRSMSLLVGGLPILDRTTVRRSIERWSIPLGLGVASFLCALIANSESRNTSLWLIGASFSAIALWALAKCLHQIGHFHMSMVHSHNLDSQIKAIQSLGTPDYAAYSIALVRTLESKPRPILTKNLLLALGRTGDPSHVSAITPYLRDGREDIQTAAAMALSQLPGHEVNLELLRVLRELVRTRQELKLSMVQALMHKLGDLSIPYLIEVLSEDSDSRVKANTIEVVGEYATQKRDYYLMHFVSKFLETRYSRRERLNAMIALYKRTPWSAQAQKILLEFISSPDPFDRSGGAYAIGVLELRHFESLLVDLCAEYSWKHKNALLSLVRLNHGEAIQCLVEAITSEENSEFCKSLILGLSYFPIADRRRLWEHLIRIAPDRISIVQHRLRASQREFDVDREILRESESKDTNDESKDQAA